MASPNAHADDALVLGIETSCDETAAAVLRGPRDVLSSVVATQHDLHEEFAGVVPEIASRAHLERILPVVRAALRDAGVTLDALDAIAVGHRPGLIGSLLVGVSAAKSLAWTLGIPLVGVDHVLAHLHAATLNAELLTFPALGLVVSGGHTSLFLMRSATNVESIGRTIDDAIGEAYDKAATILEIGYPGGPKLDAIAQHGDDRAHDFPIAYLKDRPLHFSYSGLKTALLYAVRGTPVSRDGEHVYPHAAADLSDQQRADFAASFQRAAIRPITRNIKRAIAQHPAVTCIVAGGGVTANSRLRDDLATLARDMNLPLRIPPMDYCVDNAAMIAGLGAELLASGHTDDLSLSASPRSSVA